MVTSASAAIATPRDDIGLFFEAVNLQAIRAGFIGFQVAPPIEASLKRGTYSYRDLKQTLQKIQSAKRTSEGGFNRIRSQFSRESYAVESRGLEEPVDNDAEAENLGMIDSELIAAESTRHGVLEDHELQVIALINAVTPEADLSASSGAKQWSNDTADVVKDFAIWKRQFKSQCGVQPNCMVVDETAVDFLAINPSVVEAAGKLGSNYSDALQMNAKRNRMSRLASLAAALGIEEIVESRGVHNTAGQPLAASLATTFAEDLALLCVKSTGGSMRDHQWLRTAHWSANGSRIGCAFEQYEEPQTDSRVIRHRMDTAIIEVNSECVMTLEKVIDLGLFA